MSFNIIFLLFWYYSVIHIKSVNYAQNVSPYLCSYCTPESYFNSSSAHVLCNWYDFSMMQDVFPKLEVEIVEHDTNSNITIVKPLFTGLTSSAAQV